MKRDDGVTLIELLATLSISVIFVGVLFLLFSQVNFGWNKSTQSYFDETQAQTTLDTMESFLVDSPILVYIPLSDGANEIRFRFGSDAFKAIVFNNRSIELYTYTGSLSDFTINFENSNSDYIDGTILAKNVAAAPTYQVQGQNAPLSTASKFFDGELINIQIPFIYINVDVNGSRTPQTQMLQSSVKLLLDH